MSWASRGVEVMRAKRTSDARAWADWILALRASDRLDEAEQALSGHVDGLPVWMQEIEGVAEDVWQGWRAHLGVHESLAWAPAHHATKDGFHSGELRGSPGLEDLVSLIEQLVSHGAPWFIDGAGSTSFFSYVPRDVRLKIWGIVMGETGYQKPHIHPDAFLSGVLYLGPERDFSGVNGGTFSDAVSSEPTLNQDVRIGDSAPSGALVFGETDTAGPHNAAYKPSFVRPKTGRCVIFPAHLYHHGPDHVEHPPTHQCGIRRYRFAVIQALARAPRPGSHPIDVRASQG